MKKTIWTTADIPSQVGKVILITGANSGLGFEAAKVLSSKGATIVLAVRNLIKGNEALEEIQSLYPTAKLDLFQIDLSNLDSVRHFAGEFYKKYNRLDVLINNAGIMYPPKRQLTEQGFEIQFGTNHLGHFALCGLLLDLIKKTPKARIISQSSMASRFNAKIHFDDLSLEKSYDKMKAYAQSKLANLLFTHELDRLFKTNHIDAIATVSHPGLTKTNLFRSSSSFSLFSQLAGQDVEMGILPMLRAATENGLKGGEFFGPTKLFGARGYPELLKWLNTAKDPEVAAKLWSVSEELTGVKYDFG